MKLEKKKKVIFKGLSPTDSVTFENQILKNGAIVDMPVAIADAYLKLKLAYEITDMNEAQKYQKLEEKNAQKREDILIKANTRKGRGK
jgi:hypothetical protein